MTMEGRIKRLEREWDHSAYGLGPGVFGILPDHSTSSHDSSLKQVGTLPNRSLEAPLIAVE